MKRYPIILAPLVPLLLGTLAAAQDPQPAAEPAKLTAAEIAARPELWPATCRAHEDVNYKSCKLPTDFDAPIIEFGEEELVLELPNGSRGNLQVERTDALAKANAAHAARSPAQRAVDLAMMRERADLWPFDVELTRSMMLGDKSVPVGTKFPVGNFDGEFISSRLDEGPGVRVPLSLTDFITRFRSALDAQEGKPSHRILRELEGKLVKLPKGRRASLDPRRPPDYLAVYISAGWCGPCHQFSPVLKRFYEDNKKHIGRRFEVVWVSRDRSEREMQEYLQEYEFPWIAVKWDALPDIPVTKSLNIAGIPCVVLLDKFGRVIAHSYVDGEYVGPRAVLDELQKRLDSRQ